MNRSIYKYQDKYVRLLCNSAKGLYVIDCDANHMPYWIKPESFEGLPTVEDSQVFSFVDYENISQEHRQIMHKRFTIIAPIIPVLSNDNERSRVLNKVAIENNLSHMTIREWLCKYLAAQDIRSLLPKNKARRKSSKYEQVFRKALNKYYYSEKKYTLTYCYKLMLKDYYCDEDGSLLIERPSFFQFRYFFQQNRNPQKESIRRDGIKKYQRDERPLLGDSVQEYAPYAGVGMLDSTIADIYLVNHNNEVIGRPVITACIDANTKLCCGYAVSLEGGMYSVKKMLLNVITDKVTYCKRYGITITSDSWPCNQLPAKLITDKGAEYESENLSQITELGVIIENLPAYRPDLKGPVEVFFSIIQSYFKSPLKGAGVIEPDFRSRGAKDYRKEASLNLFQFETILIKCIIYYNCNRIIENYHYSPDMLNRKVLPYSCWIWNYLKEVGASNLIDVTEDLLYKVLLPRVKGKFSRKGLIVNKARYKNYNYMFEYLSGQEVIVSYNPDNVSTVYLLDKGNYIPFELIESRYANKSLAEVTNLRHAQQAIVDEEKNTQLQASINLINSIIAIRNQSLNIEDANIQNISESRKNEIYYEHINQSKDTYE